MLPSDTVPLAKPTAELPLPFPFVSSPTGGGFLTTEGVSESLCVQLAVPHKGHSHMQLEGRSTCFCF